MGSQFLMIAVSVILALALLSTGVVYGTDMFFAVIGRRALAMSSDAGVADVMGHIHEVGDARMPVFGVLGILSTLAFLLLVGLGTSASWLGILALLAQVAFLVLYNVFSKPINLQLRHAAQSKQVPTETRTLQQRWDQVVVLRAILLFIAVSSLITAGLLR